MDLKDPHSLTCEHRVDGESQSRIERSVDSQMSNREDSLAVSGNGECKLTTGSNDRCSIAEEVVNEIDKIINVAPSASLTDSDSIKVVPCKNAVQNDEKARERNLLEMKREIPQVGRSRRFRYKFRSSFSFLEHPARGTKEKLRTYLIRDAVGFD